MSYGPFHRLESPTQTAATAKQQVASREIWGAPARLNGLFPCVKAYRGPIPANTRGIEFTTPIAPDANSSTPIEFRWYYPQTPGVERRSRDGIDYASIPAKVDNRQP